MQTETITSPQKNSDITNLTQQVDSLSRDADWYESWKDRMDFASVILIAVTLVIAFVSNRCGARLNKINKELIATKDRLNGLHIETLKAETAKANQKANEADLARVELQKALQPRTIPLIIQVKDGQKTTNIDGLKPFAGMQATIRFLPDAEPRRAAYDIEERLKDAGWVISGKRLISEQEDLIEGIQILYQEDLRGPFSKANKAAQTLASFLESYNIKAHARRAFTSANLPPNSIRITVGLKPDPRTKSELEREIENRFERAREQMQKQ